VREVPDLQEELEIAFRLGSGVGIGNTCRLPFISTHVEREPINPISGGLGDVISPYSAGVRVSLLVSVARLRSKKAHVSNHVMCPDIFSV
jgi:hypothetical protein